MGWPMFDFASAPPYQQLFDYTGSPDGIQAVYIGWATPGALTSDAKWKIRKFTYVANSSGGYNIQRIQMPSGDIGFTHVWSSSAGLTYTGPVSGAETFK